MRSALFNDKNLIRKSFLFAGISLTLLGCIVAGIGIALSTWQVVELSEFNAIHEHGIFYDCAQSEIVSLDKIRNSAKDETQIEKKIKESNTNDEEHEEDEAMRPHNDHINQSYATENEAKLEGSRSHSTMYGGGDVFAPSKRCVSKFENSAESSTWTMRMAVEEGDPLARSISILAQHKAVIFFSVFSVIFAFISVAVGACSECFVPNGVLHVISIGMSMCCSVLGDVIFFLASNRTSNRNIHGVTHIYYQHLSYGFCIHVLGSVMLFIATACATVAAYLLVRNEFRSHNSNGTKNWHLREKEPNKYVPYTYKPTSIGIVNSANVAQQTTCNTLICANDTIDTISPRSSFCAIDVPNTANSLFGSKYSSMNFYGVPSAGNVTPRPVEPIISCYAHCNNTSICNNPAHLIANICATADHSQCHCAGHSKERAVSVPYCASPTTQFSQQPRSTSPSQFSENSVSKQAMAAHLHVSILGSKTPATTHSLNNDDYPLNDVLINHKKKFTESRPTVCVENV